MPHRVDCLILIDTTIQVANTFQPWWVCKNLPSNEGTYIAKNLWFPKELFTITICFIDAFSIVVLLKPPWTGIRTRDPSQQLCQLTTCKQVYNQQLSLLLSCSFSCKTEKKFRNNSFFSVEILFQKVFFPDREKFCIKRQLLLMNNFKGCLKSLAEM